MIAVTKFIDDNNRIVLGKYEDAATAIAEAKRMFDETKERCTISVIEAEFDENDTIIGGKYRLFKSFW